MDNKRLGNYLGQAFGVVLSGSLMAIIIAITAKIVAWII